MLKGSDLFTILGAEDDVLGKALARISHAR